MAIHIGCGSWADPEYVGVLYPKKTPATQRLAVYSRTFDRVELNSFYHALPPRDRVAGWVEQTPPGFFFDVKFSKDFCVDPQAAARQPERLLAALQPIRSAKKLGAFLLTLDPSFGPDRHRLDELDGVARTFSPLAPIAVELRDRAWVEGKTRAATFAYLRERGLAWVATDLPRLDAPQILPPIDEVTLPSLAYLRLHGRNPDYLKRSADPKARHNYVYSPAELQSIADRIHALAAQARDVHVSVNTHYADYAPKAALALRQLLGQPVPPPLSDATADGDGQLSLLD